MNLQIIQTNARLWRALLLRDDKTEILDALNARRRAREIRLTASEIEALQVEYLRENAPDLLYK